MDGPSDAFACMRRVLSCSRCRKRKTKCDRQLPDCSQCRAAGALCTGVSTIDDDVQVPRSLVQFLETQIAQWEIELQSKKTENLVDLGQVQGHETDSMVIFDPKLESTDDEQSQAGRDDEECQVIRSLHFRSMIRATIPSDPALTDLVARVRMGLTPSAGLLSIAGQSPESRRVIASTSSEDESVEATTFSSLPDHVVHTLIRKYMLHIYPWSPVVSQSEINRSLDYVKTRLAASPDNSSAAVIEPNFDFLVVHLVLAISSTLGCAKSPHESRCLAFSEILFQQGISHLSANLAYPTELANLQVTLLILQYAEINPKCANIWILNGAAMRRCLELGLHQEPVRAVSLDKQTIDLRGRLFCAAYCMDRMICPALQRPSYILDEIISPQLFDVGRGGVADLSPSQNHAATLWVKYCRIQSEIAEVHFQGKPLRENWSQWLATIEGNLHSWYREHDSPDNVTEMAYAQGMVRIHRPSPRNPTPPADSLSTAFESACRLAKHKRAPIVGGILRKPWLAAHETAESAMVAIFCLRHAYDEIVAKHRASEIFDNLKVFTSNFLALAAPGFDDIGQFAATFERLLSPLITGVLMKAPSEMLSYPPTFDAELNTFLMPGPLHNDSLLGPGFGTGSYDLCGAADAFGTEICWDAEFLDTLMAGGSMDNYDWGDGSFNDCN